MSLINKLYGVDYVNVACGGVGLSKRYPYDKSTELFMIEADMLTRIAELKRDVTIENIQPFITAINRDQYVLK